MFQQISRQTHCPQRLHWVNSGRISATASWRAVSWAGPGDEVAGGRRRRCAAVPKKPPNMLPAPRSSPVAMPALLAFAAGHVPVAAALAEELELVSALGGEVLVVVGELDAGHLAPQGVVVIEVVSESPSNLAAKLAWSQEAEGAADECFDKRCGAREAAGAGASADGADSVAGGADFPVRPVGYADSQR